MADKDIYLDYAAATPMDEAVWKTMQPYFAEKFYNPAASYLLGRAVKDDIIEIKKSIAAQLGARHNEIIHTSGGTESNNLAISGVMDIFLDKKVLVSSIEHESVLNPAKKYSTQLIPVDKHGVVDLEAFERLVKDDVVLVSVMLVNNETGSVQPIRKIAAMMQKIKKTRQKQGVNLPLYLHTDACQAPCYMDINANRLGVDLLTLNGGKLYGPKGSGILFVGSGTGLQPQMLGGGQQRNLRSGTENPAALAGFAHALDIAAKKRKDESARLNKLRENFINGLADINPDITINGHPKNYAPHIVNATFPGTDNERLLFQLEEKGILAASGSACSASSDLPSHVLGAMGLSDELTRNSIRFSLGRRTNEPDIKYVISILRSLFA